MKFLALLLFSLLTLHSLKLTSAACHVDDETGLLAFKSGITHDPSGILSSWKPGTDCCDWAGIICFGDNRVTHLNIYADASDPKAFLAGTISPSLVKLQNLEGLFFLNPKNITGKFPDLVFGLPKLKYLQLENSKILGELPANIGKLTQLESLILDGNLLTGAIPSSISGLTRMTWLSLKNNFITGTIPQGISKLTNLTYLDLSHNQLSGTIPDFFSSFIDLQVVELSHNKLYGSIPPSLATLAPKFRGLALDHNELTGTIPSFLGKFKKLIKLGLSWNKFTGVVPSSFAGLTELIELDLSHNSLVDPFPTMYVKGIMLLDLSHNNFHLKQIPTWVTSSLNTTSLKLAKCGININLDDWKPQQPYLYEYIDLSDNEISGSPGNLLKAKNLVGLWVSGNKLRFDMGSLKIRRSLKHLDLSRNQIFGKVPAVVSRLQSLNVSNNHLCGQLPATKFPASSFAGNDCLCDSPLQPCRVSRDVE